MIWQWQAMSNSLSAINLCMSIVDENKDKFISIVNSVIHRDGIEALMFWLASSDFYTAPASTRFHEAYAGGLCEHSLNVYEHMKHLANAYRMNFSQESIAIVSLFHDLCKVNCYSISERNVKGPDGTWHKEPFYKWDEKACYGGHGSKSVYLVQYFIKLGFDEASAINCHMGIENGSANAIYDAFKSNPLAFLLHTADMASTNTVLNAALKLHFD